MSSRARILGLLLVALLLAPGCAKNYVITNPLGAPLPAPMKCAVGDIADGLPADMEQGKKPTAEDVQKLRRHLEEEIANRRLAEIFPSDNPAAAYEITGSVLEYKRGSGALRFIVGFGAGNAKATVGLKLIDRQTGATIYGGNFSGTVSSGLEGGDQAFRRIAKDFAKALKKEADRARK
jgi:hypothetical protein